MKNSVYLDSTIPSYIFDERESLKPFTNLTRKWWEEERQNFDIFISIETIAELSKGEYPNKEKVLDFTNQIDRLKPDDKIIEIVNYYIENKLMPLDITGDAVHLAYASYYEIDFLLTWNCNHLANANKKQHIKVLNGRMELFTPELITPLELFTEK